MITKAKADQAPATEQPIVSTGEVRQPDALVPERPALASGVELVGMMQGTGFTNQQWLVQRNGQFIQITELLYRVAEQIDGRRTLGEIAEELTQSTEWLVSAENVSQIIEAKLLPLGLVVPSAGAAPSGVVSGAVPSFSPLSVNMRMKVIGPRAIDPFTRVLQVIFASPVLIPMLVIVAAAHIWMYIANMGLVVAGLMETLYKPGLLLLVLGIVLAAAVVHEFGHASALRYGGGKVRAMGAGLYLIYPAFYTDVTDGYRLGRGARVRTDLGGVYFHLIFAAGLIAIAFLSGQYFLLVAVVLINSDVVRQFIPFVRLDGYWMLTDLTGVPDFFTQMGPFLRSVLPLRAGQGDKLPELTPWVRAVFLLFTVLTVPALAILVFLMVTNLPSFVAASWDSLLSQFEQLSLAFSGGNILGIALLFTQVLLLALPLLGTVFILFTLGRGALRGLWNWSNGAPMRKLVAGLVLAAILALVAVAWSPQVSALANGGPPGVQNFKIESRSHLDSSVTYPQSPPVGGDHSPVWQNCGFYDSPINNENGVHSLEHGAVWIAYRPDLPRKEIDFLFQTVRSQSYILASPYPGLKAPIVVSSWGRQLEFDSTDDPRLQRFVQTFRLSRQAPEAGESCTDGKGEPK
ncbi:MAG: DUF3105 domain-containing protein [Chloroflexia bacterium]